MNFELSPEQKDVIAFATDSKQNLLVSALAGAAKTTTLKKIAEALPKANIICLAFNKLTATELAEALPNNCTTLTLHGLGNTIWKQYLGLRRCDVRNGKMYAIMKGLCDEQQGEDKKAAYDEFSFMLNSCGAAKASGHLPDTFVANTKKAPEPLMRDEEMLESLDEEVSDFTKTLIRRALELSAEQSMQGIIDFDDMVLFPSLFKCMYPLNSLILVDEAQDLSPLNHRMLRQLYRKRIIAVGDQCQAIYGFRGASESGMEEIGIEFTMQELPLSCSFRCPEEIVEHVRWRAPTMTSWTGTAAGSVADLGFFGLDQIPDGAAIVCRNNAPLLTFGMALLAAGRNPNIWGNDIAKGLIKKLEALGPRNMDHEDAVVALSRYEAAQEKRVKNKKRLADTINCLRVLLDAGDTLGEACTKAKNIFSAKGPVNLMTGHKAKGSEFDNVYFLDEQLVGVEGQEPNLRYVICTRAKSTLTYIRSEECLDLLDEAGREDAGYMP